jgi:hypothetical protein
MTNAVWAVLKRVTAMGRIVLIPPFDMGGNKIINGAPGVLDSDFATVGQVQGAVLAPLVAVGHASGTKAIATIPANSVIDEVVLKTSEEWDGTLKLGDTNDDDRLVADGDWVKTITTNPSPIKIGYFYAAETVVNFKVTGTTGAGFIGLKYTRYS